MRKIIRNLRAQPEHVKKQILYISMLAFVVILILLWILSLGTTINKKETEISVKKDLQPFTILKANVIDGYKSISTESTNVVR